MKSMSLVLFYLWEGARIWSHQNSSLDMHLKYLGTKLQNTEFSSYFFHPEFPEFRTYCWRLTAVGCNLTLCVTG